MKIKKLLFILFLAIGVLKGNAQQMAFSDSSVISLITCSPGEEVYAKFGHSALRINDPVNKLDYTFNYGIFSFDSDNFYWKFIKGETDYQLGIYETAYFLPEYKERNSMVTEQILNLTIPEKRKLIELLLINYLPENRIYRYNFVFDNCSTRPRDKVLSSLNGYVRFETNNEYKTFRQWIGNYVGTDTWVKFGIDIVLGIEADRPATKGESMFLPEILMSEFQTAQVINRKNEMRKLVTEKKILVYKNETLSCTDQESGIKPMTLSLILLIIGVLITLWDLKRRRYLKWFDAGLLIISGLSGFIVFFLMFFSTHPLVKMNLNLLWLNPLNIATGVLILIKNSRLRQILFFYEIFNIVLYVAALFVFALSAQAFNSAFFPLIVLLLLRRSSWFAYTKRKLYKRRSLK